jgi:hypothetical protein
VGFEPTIKAFERGKTAHALDSAATVIGHISQLLKMTQFVFNFYLLISLLYIYRAIAQAVSRWLPTGTARVRARVWKWDLWWTKWRRCKFSPSTSVFPAKTVRHEGVWGVDE